MLNLAGLLPASQLEIVRGQAQLRFADYSTFTTPEAVILYEQQMVSEEVLKEACERAYGGIKLETPEVSYIPRELLREFDGKDCVPIQYDTANMVIRVGVLPEKNVFIPDVRGIRVEKVLVPIYYYVTHYTRCYKEPKFLYAIPASDKFQMITEEALSLEASDITISVLAKGATVYYNCRKKKVFSKRALSEKDVVDIATLLTTKAGCPIADNSCKPKSFSVQLGLHHRGRVLLSKTYYGRSMTIRVLSDEILNTTLEELNISEDTCTFVRDVMESEEKGLRLFVGETHSGKNTTILAALQEIIKRQSLKVISIEQPVEILTDGIEQISVETDEEYKENAAALLRQNPDIVYVAEMSYITALDTMTASNTGKVVFSTIHANSVSDTIARIQDLTGLSSDRILLSLQSVCYQVLVRNEEEDKLYPKNTYVHFTDALKEELYGKSVGEIKQILSREENHGYT